MTANASRILRMILALAGVAAAVGIRWLLDPFLHGHFTVATSLAAVALAVWLTGWRGGVVAAVAAYLACDYLFIEPRGSIGISNPTDAVGLGLYAIACAVVVWTGEWMRRLHRAASQNANLAQAQLWTVLDLLPVAAVIADADGRPVTINSAAGDLWGSDPGGPLPHKAFWPQAGDPVRLPDWTMNLASTEGATAQEVEFEAINGRRGTMLNYARPIQDPGGRVLGGVAIQVDISERKAAERALGESERRFRLMADSAPVLIWMSGPDKLCTWFNRPWLEFVGRTLEQEYGNGWAENVHPDDFERCLATYTGAFDRREPFTMEYRLKRHDGEYRWLLDNGVPRSDPDDGSFSGYVGSCIDITDRRRAMDELSFHKHALDVSSIVAITDPEGRITYVNDTFCDVSGYSRDELIGQDHRIMKSGVHSDAFYRDLYRTIERGKVWRGEVCNRRRDGSLYWLDTTIVPAMGPDGRPDHFVTIRSDATERKLAERVRERHAEDLAQAVRRTTEELTRAHERQRATERIASMGSLAAGLGHDMNNLMLPIQAELDQLKDGRLDEDGRRQSVAAIESSISYLRSLARGLRLLSHDPDVDARGARTDLAQWWSESRPLLKSVLPRGVRLEGEVVGECSARIAPHQLAQLVYNLVQNSGDAMKGRAAGLVKMRAETIPADADPSADAGHVVRLTITDDGPGMTADVRQRCMDPFFSTKQKSHVGGLGLSLVRSIVEAVEGRIDLVTAPGQGASFIITLPAAPAKVQGPGQGAAVVSVADERLRATATWVLGTLGLETSTRSDGDDARLWISDSQSRAEAIAFARRGSGVAVILGDPQPGTPGAAVLEVGPEPTAGRLREAVREALGRTAGRAAARSTPPRPSQPAGRASGGGQAAG